MEFAGEKFMAKTKKDERKMEAFYRDILPNFQM
jgi:hypothetical protein